MKNTVLVSVLCFALLGLSMSMPIVGGKSDPQPVDDNAKAAASTVINKLNTDKELRAGLGASVESLKLVDITSVRTQVSRVFSIRSLSALSAVYVRGL